MEIGDEVVWGGGFNYQDGGYYDVFAGLTWAGEGFVFDGLVDVDDEGDMMYYLSFLYSFTDELALGLNYFDAEGSGMVALKGEYLLGEGTLTFSYTTSTKSGSEGGVIGLGYEMEL